MTKLFNGFCLRGLTADVTENYLFAVLCTGCGCLYLPVVAFVIVAECINEVISFLVCAYGTDVKVIALIGTCGSYCFNSEAMGKEVVYNVLSFNGAADCTGSYNCVITLCFTTVNLC